MGQKHSFDDLGFVESGNWNVAELYSRIKIMSPLKEFDEYKKMAISGCIEIGEEFLISDQVKTDSRLKALRRMFEAMETLVDNSLFAIKKKPDKDKMLHYKKILEKVEGWLPYTQKVITQENARGRSQMTQINEVVFDIIFKALKRLHREILEPLNNSDLIFYSVEEFDPDKFKDAIKKRIINQP